MPPRISMTRKQRDALLTLPETEVEVLRHHMLGPADLAAVNQCRTPETRLSCALQLCCLRFPGRYLSRGELLPGIMLDHIADQVQADADVITLFARRGATRYEQLTSIKQRHGFRDLSGGGPSMSLPTIPLTAPITNWPPTSSLPMRLRAAACGLRHREFTARSKSSSRPLHRQLRRNRSLWFTLSMPKTILQTAWLRSMLLF